MCISIGACRRGLEAAMPVRAYGWEYKPAGFVGIFHLLLDSVLGQSPLSGNEATCNLRYPTNVWVLLWLEIYFDFIWFFSWKQSVVIKWPMINTIVKMAFTVVNCCPPVYHLYFVVGSQMHAEHFSFVILYKIISRGWIKPISGPGPARGPYVWHHRFSVSPVPFHWHVSGLCGWCTLLCFPRWCCCLLWFDSHRQKIIKCVILLPLNILGSRCVSICCHKYSPQRTSAWLGSSLTGISKSMSGEANIETLQITSSFISISLPNWPAACDKETASTTFACSQ